MRRHYFATVLISISVLLMSHLTVGFFGALFLVAGYAGLSLVWVWTMAIMIRAIASPEEPEGHGMV